MAEQAQEMFFVYSLPKPLATIYTTRAKPINPTEKPFNLIAHLISCYTTAGDMILDLCGGSGVITEAVVRLGRNMFGVEKDLHQYSGII